MLFCSFRALWYAYVAFVYLCILHSCGNASGMDKPKTHITKSTQNRIHHQKQSNYVNMNMYVNINLCCNCSIKFYLFWHAFRAYTIYCFYLVYLYALGFWWVQFGFHPLLVFWYQEQEKNGYHFMHGSCSSTFNSFNYVRMSARFCLFKWISMWF